jgi:hypothetical protein
MLSIRRKLSHEDALRKAMRPISRYIQQVDSEVPVVVLLAELLKQVALDMGCPSMDTASMIRRYNSGESVSVPEALAVAAMELHRLSQIATQIPDLPQ